MVTATNTVSTSAATLILMADASERAVRIASRWPEYSFSHGVITALGSMRFFVAALGRADEAGQLEDLACGRSTLSYWGSLAAVREPEILRGLLDLDKLTIENNRVDLGGVDAPQLTSALRRFIRQMGRMS